MIVTILTIVISTTIHQSYASVIKVCAGPLLPLQNVLSTGSVTPRLWGSYRPANTRLHGFDDSLMGCQHGFIHNCLVLTELAAGWEGAGDITVITVVLTPHVQQKHIIAANLPVWRTAA